MEMVESGKYVHRPVISKLWKQEKISSSRQISQWTWWGVLWTCWFRPLYILISFFFVSKKSRKHDSLDNFSSDNRLLKRLFFGNSCELKIDKVGRVLIPQTILDKAHIKLDKEVILVGVYDHLELWDLETYNEKNNSSDDEKCYEALAERLAAK